MATNMTAYNDIVHMYRDNQIFWTQVEAMSAHNPLRDKREHVVLLAQIRAELIPMDDSIRRDRIPEIATEKYGYPVDLFNHDWLAR
ncbi:hypothetical protein [Mesorhizobium sp. B4-1-4]|uniref:hypothetical protein n=1 Tax=Mesorhizobium sp. B4-1-4 TaxID=2589888 RepID=UPI001128018B|nr:hypothetical protein [Mesorhizobium sp. B4-1-4]UCI32529.1 hypothetical protein FJW03_03480 [Mesorhizobium sp. B4-1-4]